MYLRLNEKGFSLIELLVVVAIIGILAAVGIVAYSGYTESARINAVKANHKLAVQIINQELMRCQVEDKIRYWNNRDKKCEVSSCQWSPDPFSYNFWKISDCLDLGETFKRNPFDNSDPDGAYVSNRNVPTVKQLGRTHCRYEDKNNAPNGIPRAVCYSRWGSGQNDYDTTTIQNPF